MRGLLFCADCGAPLGVIARETAGGETLYHICRTYQQSGKAGGCTAHNAREDELRARALETLAALCAPYLTADFLRPEAEKALAEARKRPPDDTEARLSALTRRLELACSDRLDGLLTKEDFARVYEKLCRERAALEARLARGQTSAVQPAPDALCAEFAAALTGPLLFSLLSRAELGEDRLLTLRLRCRAPAAGAPPQITDPEKAAT